MPMVKINTMIVILETIDIFGLEETSSVGVVGVFAKNSMIAFIFGGMYGNFAQCVLFIIFSCRSIMSLLT